MVKNGTPKYCGSVSNGPRIGTGTAAPESRTAAIAWYCVAKFASKNKVWLVGWTRKTFLCSERTPSSSQATVAKMVSLENPLEPGACTSRTAALASLPSSFANQEVSEDFKNSGSRFARSGMGECYAQFT